MNHIVENIPLLIISISIVVVQLLIFLSTSKKIKILNTILNNHDKFRKSDIYIDKKHINTTKCEDVWKHWSYYRLSPEDKSKLGLQYGEEEITVPFIDLSAEDEVTTEISKSINTYLIRNKGAASDFNLIKDIVERNCDTLASEIDSQVSMPLYLGLIGTVAGIVIGLGSLALQGIDLGDSGNIIALMVGVAFAMIASGMGVLFTSWSIWKNKKCIAQLETNKNNFYTWIQTELLPVLSNSTVSTLTLLERNLNHFNEAFNKTVVKLDQKLSDVGDLYSSQIELLDRIQKMDVTKMASANIKILETLTQSADKLKDFAQYMDRTTEYLSAVKELNGKIDEHLERTEALGTVAAFYKSQMAEIYRRQNDVKGVATSIDDVVKKALADLKKNTETGLNGLKEVYTTQNEKMKQMAREEGEALNGTIKKLDAMITLSKELQRMPQTVAELSRNATNQSKAISELARAVSKLQVQASGSRGGGIRRVVKNVFSSIWHFISYPFRKNKTKIRQEPYTQDLSSQPTLPLGRKSNKPYNPKKIDRL